MTAVAVFDLTTNPFWLLRTSIRARQRDVIDALELAVSNEVAPESDLIRAQQMEQLAETIRRACERGDRDSFDDAERAVQEMRDVLYGILFNEPSYLAFMFRSICENRYLAVDKTLHDLLVKDGEEAIANEDLKGLRKALGRMMANRFEVGTNKAITALAGLMRA